MGGRGSSSGFRAGGSNPTVTSSASASSTASTAATAGVTHTLTYSVPGKADMSVDVKYTGTDAELRRADQITATVIRNILLDARLINGALYLDKPAMMPRTQKWLDWYDQQTEIMREQGYPITGDGLRQLRLDTNGALKFIRNAQKAQDVIDKYGSRVPASAGVPGSIRGAR